MINTYNRSTSDRLVRPESCIGIEDGFFCKRCVAWFLILLSPAEHECMMVGIRNQFWVPKFREEPSPIMMAFLLSIYCTGSSQLTGTGSSYVCLFQSMRFGGFLKTKPTNRRPSRKHAYFTMLKLSGGNPKGYVHTKRRTRNMIMLML
jgi:hypothetical protein